MTDVGRQGDATEPTRHIITGASPEATPPVCDSGGIFAVARLDEVGRHAAPHRLVVLVQKLVLAAHDAARLLPPRAISKARYGVPRIQESSIARCFANEIARTVTGNAVQLMGGYGNSREYRIERRMRDALGWGIAGGAICIQTNNIASAIVGRRFNQRAQ